jgi:hypothetical protein
MQLLEEAILKNTCPPRPGEKFTQSKKLRVSGEVEGDSQLGMILFVGVANYFNITRADTTEFIGIEPEEYDYKLRKFHDGTDTEETRMTFKFKLVSNYVKLYASTRRILLRG